MHFLSNILGLISIWTGVFKSLQLFAHVDLPEKAVLALAAGLMSQQRNSSNTVESSFSRTGIIASLLSISSSSTSSLLHLFSSFLSFSELFLLTIRKSTSSIWYEKKAKPSFLQSTINNVDVFQFLNKNCAMWKKYTSAWKHSNLLIYFAVFFFHRCNFEWCWFFVKLEEGDGWREYRWVVANLLKIPVRKFHKKSRTSGKYVKLNKFIGFYRT